MARNLSFGQKMKYLSLITERDGGFKCLYCGKPLTYKTAIFEHLNDDRKDNRLDNIALAHQSCNIKKKTDGNFSDIAILKREENEKGIFVGEKNLQSIISPFQAQEISKEISINKVNFDTTEKFIAERIANDGFILYSDALNSSVYLCKKNSGHGSHQSVRNYISSLTSPVAPFEIIKNDDGKKIIVKKDSE